MLIVHKQTINQKQILLNSVNVFIFLNFEIEYSGYD